MLLLLIPLALGCLYFRRRWKLRLSVTRRSRRPRRPPTFSSPRSWATREVLTASMMNTEVPDHLRTLGNYSSPDTTPAAPQLSILGNSLPWSFPARPRTGRGTTEQTDTSAAPNSALTPGPKLQPRWPEPESPPTLTILTRSATASAGGPAKSDTQADEADGGAGDEEDPGALSRRDYLWTPPD